MKNTQSLADKLVASAQVAQMAAATDPFAARLAALDKVQGRAVAAALEHGLNVKRLPLTSILDREDGDLRPINIAHVVELADSIVAVGLLQFPIVDQNNHLLAGGHRRAAIALLHELSTADDDGVRKAFEPENATAADRLSDEDIARYRSAFQQHFADGIPVTVFDTSAHTGQDASSIRLEIEAIENEKRLDFTKDEIAGIVERLRAAGYREIAGQPRPGQRVLSKELGRIIGKSRRTVFRMLHEVNNPGATKGTVSESLKELARELSEKLETRVAFQAGQGQSGKIVINYESHKHRNTLLKTLRLQK